VKLPEIRQSITVEPDVAKLHALAALVEKHAAAFRADLEALMGGEKEKAGD
jgi:hypothetical protein